MKNYEKPIIIEDNNILEGVYLNSGGYDTHDDVTLKWYGQDGGSHSELRLIVKTNKKPVHSIKVDITFNGSCNVDYYDIGCNRSFSPTINGNNLTFVCSEEQNNDENGVEIWWNGRYSYRKNDPSTSPGSYYDGSEISQGSDAVAIGDYGLSYEINWG